MQGPHCTCTGTGTGTVAVWMAPTPRPRAYVPTGAKQNSLSAIDFTTSSTRFSMTNPGRPRSVRYRCERTPRLYDLQAARCEGSTEAVHT